MTSLPEAKGQAFVLAASGRYTLSPRLSLTLGVPLVLGSVAQPAGSYVDAAALGNPQLGARYRFVESRSAEAALALAGAVELGAPLASHAQNLMPNRVLAIADGIEGRGHPEWFTPGVTTITPSTTLAWASSSWWLRLSLLIHFGSRAALVVDLQTAIAGELGGSLVAGGLRGLVYLR